MTPLFILLGWGLVAILAYAAYEIGHVESLLRVRTGTPQLLALGTIALTIVFILASLGVI